MLQTLETQTTFLALIAVDVAALKIVLCSLDGRAAKLVEKQVAITSDKFRSVAESQRREIEKLRQLVSLLPTPKPN